MNKIEQLRDIFNQVEKIETDVIEELKLEAFFECLDLFSDMVCFDDGKARQASTYGSDVLSDAFDRLCNKDKRTRPLMCKLILETCAMLIEAGDIRLRGSKYEGEESKDVNIFLREWTSDFGDIGIKVERNDSPDKYVYINFDVMDKK